MFRRVAPNFGIRSKITIVLASAFTILLTLSLLGEWTPAPVAELSSKSHRALSFITSVGGPPPSFLIDRYKARFPHVRSFEEQGRPNGTKREDAFDWPRTRKLFVL